MTIYPIVWSPSIYTGEESIGMVNSVAMFVISKKGKKKVTYTLKSNPFKNDTFTRANNYKKLLEGDDLDALKKYAEKKLAEFVSIFVKPAELEPATLTMMTTMHVLSNGDRGIVISDIDGIIDMAKDFEKKYKEMRPGGKDWEKSKNGWETTIVNFYNKHKPLNWNAIF